MNYANARSIADALCGIFGYTFKAKKQNTITGLEAVPDAPRKRKRSKRVAKKVARYECRSCDGRDFQCYCPRLGRSRGSRVATEAERCCAEQLNNIKRKRG